MSLEEVWAIGLFEGEGSITLNKRYKAVSIQITSTDLDVLQRFANVFGGGHFYDATRYHGRKQAWNYYISKRAEVRKVLNRMLPFLGERRACKALDAFDRLDGCYEDYGKTSDIPHKETTVK